MQQPMHPLIIPFFIPHAGCPHACLYCNQRLTAREPEGLPRPERIEATVRQWVRRSPGRPAEAAFFGGSFTALPQERQRQVLGAVQPLIDEGLVAGIRVSTRPDGLDGSALELLATYRVRTVEIGVQSLDDRVLQRAGRGHGAAESRAAIGRVAAAGFRTGAQLLPGLPGDTPERSLASLAGVISAGAQFVRIYPALVLAGTGLAELYAAGDWQPPSLEATVRLCARMLLLAGRAGVPVIRLGLQSDEGLVAGETVLAGPWHPALGQLARSELYYFLARVLAGRLEGPPERIFCHPDRMSDVVGHGRRNLLRWRQREPALQGVAPDTGLEPDELSVQSCGNRVRGSILTTLTDEEICVCVQNPWPFSKNCCPPPAPPDTSSRRSVCSASTLPPMPK